MVKIKLCSRCGNLLRRGDLACECGSKDIEIRETMSCPRCHAPIEGSRCLNCGIELDIGPHGDGEPTN